MGDDKIVLRLHSSRPQYPRDRPTHLFAWTRYNETEWCNMSHATLLSLPKVSRQVYFETATLGYALGAFTLHYPTSTLDFSKH
jgi:hypothetical protein